mgnify:CR=1 FL=1|tara:strand:+ start:1650 stop:2021 length:372 start_codon:yes stop_codon:yes gene_type:complete
MIVSKSNKYTLLLSHDPCELFKHFNLSHLHGLNSKDCKKYNNTSSDSYIAGMCNYIPSTDKLFIFINLSRCTSDIVTMGLVMHETMHLAFKFFKDEEQLITFAEKEAYKISLEITYNIKNGKY